MPGYKKITGADGVPFVKGDRRINRQGRPAKLPDLDALLAKTLGTERNNVTAMELILQALLSKAQKGDTRSAELLLDRAYGKLIARQQIEMTLDALSADELTLLTNYRISKDENRHN